VPSAAGGHVEMLLMRGGGECAQRDAWAVVRAGVCRMPCGAIAPAVIARIGQPSPLQLLMSTEGGAQRCVHCCRGSLRGQ
jgi:hypothetical protein